MIVLVDTSIWIEFFKPKPSLDISPLKLLIEERRVATCFPVKAEVLSGAMSRETRQRIEDALESMIFIDLDWNASTVWDAIAKLALWARERRFHVPGILDRMILVASKERGSQLWTLDRGLKKLAEAMELTLFKF